MKNIYVGNLSWEATEDQLKELFGAHGAVEKVAIITENGRSKGFGFVEMPEDKEGEAAIRALDGQDFQGRPLRVNEARPRQPR